MVQAPEAQESQFRTLGDRAQQADEQREVGDDEPAQLPAQLNDDEAHRACMRMAGRSDVRSRRTHRVALHRVHGARRDAPDAHDHPDLPRGCVLALHGPTDGVVVILSFRCEHCGNQNAEVQPASRIQERGSVYTVKVTDREDLNRQLVRSEYCTVTVPEFELTIPARKGQLTTVEGIIEATVRDLAMDQDERMHQSAELYDKIETLLA